MSFTGFTAELPIGDRGLTGNPNASQISADRLIKANNMAYEGGNILREGGASKYNSTAITGTPSIIGGFDFWENATTQSSVIFTSAGAILKDTGAGTYGTTLASGLTVTSTLKPTFVEAGQESAANARKMFVLTADNQVQVSAAGAACAAIATPPTDWASGTFPITGDIHEGRFWGAGNANDPHRVYYSTTGNHEDLTGAGSGSISVYPGEGRGIRAIKSYQGFLFVFKYPKGIYVVDTSAVAVTDWKVRRQAKNVGIVSPTAIDETSNDVVFVSPEGRVHSLVSTDTNADAEESSLTDLLELQPELNDILTQGSLEKTVLTYYERKKELHIGMPHFGATDGSIRLVFDYSDNQLRARMSDRDKPVSLWSRRGSNDEEILMLGDDAGFVWNMDQDAINKDGEAFSSSWQTATTNLSFVDPQLATKRKNWEFLWVVLDPKGPATVDVDVISDGVLIQSVAVESGAAGATLPVTLPIVLGGEKVLLRRHKLSGSGIWLSLDFSNNRLNEQVAISRAFVDFTVSDERIR